MSREIKFRAWREDIVSTEPYGRNSFERKFMENDIEDIKTREFGSFEEKGFVKARRVDIMQYIGIPDKNGKEIYEGDICKFFDNTYNANLLGIVKLGQYEQDGSGSEYPPTPVIGFYVEIIKYQFTEDSFYDDEDEYPEWNRKMSVLEAMDGNTYFDFEVIGNVHENSDLLKEAGNE